MFDTKPLIQKLKAYRQQKNIKQGDIAKRLGVSGPTLSRWLNDKASFNPTLNQLISMAEMFGVSLIELLSQDNNAPQASSEEKLAKKKKPTKRTEKASSKAKASTKAKAATASGVEEKKPVKRTAKSKTSTAATVKGAEAKKTAIKEKSTKTERKTPVKKAAKATREKAAKLDSGETPAKKQGRARKTSKA